MAITPKPVKVFSREEPCTKVDLFNCFSHNGAYVRRAIVEARGEIGVNAIKYLLKKGLASVVEEGNVAYWELTGEGEFWLRDGLARHLVLHPADVALITDQAPAPLRSGRAGAKVLRRTR